MGTLTINARPRVKLSPTIRGRERFVVTENGTAIGPRGYSAYEVAVQEGFVGTEAEWLDSLQGADGTIGVDGKSAYQVWLDNGNAGTEADFLLSLEGNDGAQGQDGKSAYQIAVDNGYTGTEEEWASAYTALATLQQYYVLMGNAQNKPVPVETVLSSLTTGDFTGAYAGLATEANWADNLCSNVAGQQGDMRFGVGSTGTKYYAFYSQSAWNRVYSDSRITSATLIAALQTAVNWAKVSDGIYSYTATTGDLGQQYYANGLHYICVNGATKQWLRFGQMDTVTTTDVTFLPAPQVAVAVADNGTLTIPAKYDVVHITVEAETTTAGNISIGSADGLSDVVASTALPTVVGTKKRLTYLVNADYPTNANRTLYVNISSSATVKLLIVTQKMFA